MRKHLRLFVHLSLFPSAANAFSVGLAFVDFLFGRMSGPVSVVMGVGGCWLLSVSVVVPVVVFSGVAFRFSRGSSGNRRVIK